MRDDVNRINAGSPLQLDRHLGKAIRRAIQNEHLRWLHKAVDQRMVVGDAAIDKDDALGHGVDPHKAAYFPGASRRPVSLASPASSFVPMRSSPRNACPVPNPCLAALFD